MSTPRLGLSRNLRVGDTSGIGVRRFPPSPYGGRLGLSRDIRVWGGGSGGVNTRKPARWEVTSWGPDPTYGDSAYTASSFILGSHLYPEMNGTTAWSMDTSVGYVFWGDDSSGSPDYGLPHGLIGQVWHFTDETVKWVYPFSRYVDGHPVNPVVRGLTDVPVARATGASVIPSDNVLCGSIDGGLTFTVPTSGSYRIRWRGFLDNMSTGGWLDPGTAELLCNGSPIGSVDLVWAEGEQNEARFDSETADFADFVVGDTFQIRVSGTPTGGSVSLRSQFAAIEVWGTPSITDTFERTVASGWGVTTGNTAQTWDNPGEPGSVDGTQGILTKFYGSLRPSATIIWTPPATSPDPDLDATVAFRLSDALAGSPGGYGDYVHFRYVQYDGTLYSWYTVCISGEQGMVVHYWDGSTIATTGATALSSWDPTLPSLLRVTATSADPNVSAYLINGSWGDTFGPATHVYTRSSGGPWEGVNHRNRTFGVTLASEVGSTFSLYVNRLDIAGSADW